METIKNHVNKKTEAGTYQRLCKCCNRMRKNTFFGIAPLNKDGLMKDCQDCHNHKVRIKRFEKNPPRYELSYNKAKAKIEEYQEFLDDLKQKQSIRAEKLQNKQEAKQEQKRLIKKQQQIETFLDAIADFKGEWKHIPENEDYICLDDGRVWSLINKIFLKTANHRLGYLFIGRFTINGKRKLCLLHQVVAHTFLPPIEGCDEINHINFDKKDCSVSNLERCDRKHNMNHAIQNGILKPFGDKQKKLTQEQVDDIREIRKRTNLSCKIIGDIFGVSSSCVGSIVNNINWKTKEDL